MIMELAKGISCHLWQCLMIVEISKMSRIFIQSSNILQWVANIISTQYYVESAFYWVANWLWIFSLWVIDQNLIFFPKSILIYTCNLQGNKMMQFHKQNVHVLLVFFCDLLNLCYFLPFEKTLCQETVINNYLFPVEGILHVHVPCLLYEKSND